MNRKILALWLAAVMLVSALPFDVFASSSGVPLLQNHVTQITSLQSRDSGTNLSNNYSLYLTWNQPLLARRDTTAIGPGHLANGQEVFNATSYQINYRNATQGGSWSSLMNVADDDPGTAKLLAAEFSRTLEPGSLYEFEIVPSHNNEYRVDALNPIVERAAPMDSSSASQKMTAIFLTDIEVEAVGNTGALTINWSRPSWDGEDLFDEYLIGFRVRGDGDINLPYRITAAELETFVNEDGNEMFTFTIADNSLSPGVQYDAAVEPVYRRDTVRTETIHEINYENKLYYLGYRDARTTGQYKTVEPAMIKPLLTATTEGDRDILLEWSNLASYTELYESIHHVDVNELLPDYDNDDVFDATQIIDTVISYYGEENAALRNYAAFTLREPLTAKKRYQVAIYLFDNNGNMIDEPIITNSVVIDPTYTSFTPYMPEIVNLGADPEIAALDPLQFVAFAREPYPPEDDSIRNPEYDKYIEMELEYEFYVSDSMENLEDLDEPLVTYPASVFSLVTYYEPVDYSAMPPNYQPPKIPTFEPVGPILRQYVTDDGFGWSEPLDLEGNKVYYVKIIAVRESGQRSKPAYGSVYMPPYGDIISKSPMIDAPPLRVKLPPPENPTNTTITVEWDTKYLQIYNPYGTTTDQDGSWHSVVGLSSTRGNPNVTTTGSALIYGKTAMDLPGIDTETGDYVILNDILKDDPQNSALYRELVNLDLSDSRYPERLSAFLSRARGAVIEAFDDMYAGIGQSNPFTEDDIVLRVVDISSDNIRYEYHVVEYEIMRQSGGYEQYRRMYLDGIAAADNWMPLNSPVQGRLTDMLEYTVAECHTPSQSPLTENTSYVIYLRPYESRITDGQAYLPNYTTGTTAQDKPPIFVDPVTPRLQVDTDETTDTSITVFWDYLEGLEYDLVLVEWPDAYPAAGDVTPGSGELIPWTAVIPPNSEIRDGTGANSGKKFMYYTIDNLFPLTSYMMGIRARAVQPDGSVRVSPWSNPVEETTEDIIKPIPPIGLGLASNGDLDIYNNLNNTDYDPVESNAINIMWETIPEDDAALSTDGAAANAPAGVTAEALILSSLINNYIVRFGGLAPNAAYNIRAKSIKTITRAGRGRGAVTKTVSYVIEVAEELDYYFENPIRFTIPVVPETDDMAESNFRQKESDWTDTITITTQMSDDQFGGNIDPEMYPLPERDWEIIYYEDERKLKFRFRSNLTDEEGVKDQYADQRFISRLVSERVFVYGIDLSDFRGEDILTREVEMPFTVMQAFDERQITMKVKAGDYDLRVPPGSFDTAQVRELQMGAGSNLIMTLAGEPSGLPSLNENETFSAQPQRLSARAVTPSRTVNIEAFARPIEVSLSMTGHTTPEGAGTELFYASPNTGSWQSISGTYSYAYGGDTLSGQVPRAGSFAGVTRLTPEPVIPVTRDASFDAMQRVTRRLSITDMNQYNAAEVVTSNSFNNLVAAVAMEKQTATLGGSLSPADRQSLDRAGLLTGGTLTREAAMSSMVKLYELKTKQILRPMTTPETLPGIEYASAPYRNSLLKAADLGFIADELDPANPLTMGDLMIMLDIVLGDMG